MENRLNRPLFDKKKTDFLRQKQTKIALPRVFYGTMHIPHQVCKKTYFEGHVHKETCA